MVKRRTKVKKIIDERGKRVNDSVKPGGILLFIPLEKKINQL